MPLLSTEKKSYNTLYDTVSTKSGYSSRSYNSRNHVTFEDVIKREKRKLLFQRLGLVAVFVSFFVIGLAVSLTVPVEYGLTEPDVNCSLPVNGTDNVTQSSLCPTQVYTEDPTDIPYLS